MITDKGPETVRPELVSGNYLVRFEARTLDDIRALGGNDAADDLRFATVARVSEINQSLYRTLASPIVRATVNDQTADWLRQMHPHRLRYEAFSDKNPLLQPVRELAEGARANRRPVTADNPFLAMQEAVSRQIVQAFDMSRDARDWWTEAFFMTVYGSQMVQAMVGLRSDDAAARRHIGRDVTREAAVHKTAAELEAHVERGGVCEAVVRALLYVGLGSPKPAVDERAFTVLRQIRAEHPESGRLSLAQFKELVKEQYLMLRIAQERAIAALPKLLPGDAKERLAALAVIRRVASAAGEPAGEAKTRLARIEALFAAATGPDAEQWEVMPMRNAPARGRQRGEDRPKNGGGQRSP